MPFPLSYRREIECSPASGVAVLLNRMSEELQREGLQNVYVWNDGITFDGTKAQPRSRRNPFGGLDGGEIEISVKGRKLAVSYRLRFGGLVLITAACAIIGFMLLDIKGGIGWTLSPLLWLAIMWLAGIVANYVQTARAFAALMRRVLKGV
jgi:hypothetical protein